MNCAVYVRLCLAPHPPRLSAAARHRTRATTTLHSECNAMPHNCVWMCTTTYDWLVYIVVCRLSEEMTECFKWYEEHYPKWLHPGHNKTPQVIISICLPVLSPPSLPSSFPPLLFRLHIYACTPCTPFLTAEFSGSCSQFKVSFTYTTCTVRMHHVDITSYTAMHCLSQVTITLQTSMTCLCKYTVAQIWTWHIFSFLVYTDTTSHSRSSLLES